MAIQMTLAIAKVLALFLKAPTDPRYGTEIMKAVGVSSGSLYPILARLEKAGWIEGALEDIDPREAKRPRRRNYTLTPDGVVEARQLLAEFHELTRLDNPTAGSPGRVTPGRLGPAGGHR